MEPRTDPSKVLRSDGVALLHAACSRSFFGSTFGKTCIKSEKLRNQDGKREAYWSFVMKVIVPLPSILPAKKSPEYIVPQDLGILMWTRCTIYIDLPYF